MLLYVEARELNVIALMTYQLEKRAQEAIKENGVFRLGLSGGSVLNYFVIGVPMVESDFSRWRIFFCDERYVPSTDKDSTFGRVKAALAKRKDNKLSENQFFPINTTLSLDDCAKDYEERILKEFATPSEDDSGSDCSLLDENQEHVEKVVDGGVAAVKAALKEKKAEEKPVDDNPIPRFDLLLLGVGPDGHTCSLFPDHALLNEKKRLIAPIDDSPKPPSRRITMTLPLINRAKCCIFPLCGEAKAPICKRVFIKGEKLPAGLVAPENGEVIHIFDRAAVGKYFKDIPQTFDY